MPEPMPEVRSAGSYGDVAPIALASTRECNTLRKVRLVQNSPLFANVSPADCQEIVSAASESDLSRRDIIFLEGDPIRRVILLTSGNAKVIRLGQNGTEVILRLAGPGDGASGPGSSPFHGASGQCLHRPDLGGQRISGLGRALLRAAAQHLKRRCGAPARTRGPLPRDFHGKSGDSAESSTAALV